MGYSKETLDDLKRSGLTRKDARRRSWEELSRREVRKLTRISSITSGGYKITHFDENGKETEYFRIRFHKEQPIGKDGKYLRYWQPKNSRPEAYLDPTVSWDDELEEILITEGEKKSAKANKALKSLEQKIRCLSLGGVDSYQSRKRDIKLLPYLANISPKVRVEIAFDADFKTNENVRRAAYRLADRMTDAGCQSVVFVMLPDGMKLDDYFLTHTAEDFLQLERRAFTVRDRCEAARAEPSLKTRERHQAIFRLISDDMRDSWTGHRVRMGDTDSLFIFDKRAARLYPFDDARDPDLKTRLNQLYGINGSEPEWSWLHEELSTHFRRTADLAQLHELSAAKGKRLYVYNGDHKLFRVDKDGNGKGWSLKSNGFSGKLFRNPGMEKIKPAKEPCGHEAMELLVNTPNLEGTDTYTADHMRLLLECWIWSLFFPHLLPTRPILLLYGPKGSRKTSTGRRVKQTLFGASKNVSSVDPENPRDVAAALMNEYLAVLDNVDGAHKGVENLFAVAATGGDYVERKLYVNGQMHAQPLDAFIIATSRDPKPFRRDDVADRLLILSLARSEKFSAESTVLRRTVKNRPRFWRYVLDTLPAVLRKLSIKRKTQQHFRLADFAAFCFAIAPVIGRTEAEVRKALEAHEQHKAEFELETSSLPGAITEALRLRKGKTIEGVKAKELLKILKAANPDFPYQSSVSLGKAIQAAKSGLRRYDIEVKGTPDRKGIMEYTLKLSAGDAGDAGGV